MTSKTSYNFISALKDINKTKDIKDINKTQGRGRTKRRKRKTKQRTSFRFPNKKQAGKRLYVNFKFIILSQALIIVFPILLLNKPNFILANAAAFF